MVIDAKIQVDVYHWHGSLGEEQCNAVADALNAVDAKHRPNW
jgi:hypothetical protein